MPKEPTYPILIDECNTIDISLLNHYSYLKDNQTKNGTLSWVDNGRVDCSISIQTRMYNNPCLLISYRCDDKHIKSTISLTYLPSNIGNGKVWYFVCPYTGKRCRKLHHIEHYFIHRSAIKNAMYSKQIRNKQWRMWDALYGDYYNLDDNYMELYKKHRKTTYKGKPTKEYSKLMQKINHGESIPDREIQRLYRGLI